MKKVLIVYEPLTQTGLIKSIIRNSKTSEIDIVGFNINNWEFTDNENKIPWRYRLLQKLKKIPFIGVRLVSLFNTGILKLISKDYDAIDITFFISTFYPFADYLIAQNKTFKITIWGSDFYRASQKDLEKKRKYFEAAKVIQVATSTMKSDISKVYPTITDKIIVCNNGLDNLDEIQKQRQNRGKYLNLNDNGRIIVTCGYNLGRAQQHLKIIESISALPDRIKDNLHIVIPMTYGRIDTYYKEEVRHALNESGLLFTMLDKSLSKVELADMRLQSDIVINIQTTDALAASLVEHLYAGSILIVGDWLPYSIFDENGIRYFKTDVNSLSSVIKNVVEHFTLYKELCGDNIPKAERMSSWKYKSVRFKEIYQDLVIANK